MERADSNSIPPVIPAPPRARSLAIPIAAALALLAVVAAAATRGYDLSILHCKFLAATGIPCPFCGGTRSLRALSEGDLLNSFLLNPLVFLASISLVAGLCDWLVAKEKFSRRLWPRVEPCLSQLLFGAILLNWLFVLMRTFAER